MTRINVVENVMKANDTVAEANRKALAGQKLLAVNLMSSPGSGKTTLLQKTIPALGQEAPCAVFVGDLQTTRDAERLESCAARVIQINTGTGCHLSAPQVGQAIEQSDMSRYAYLFIENVGNMVCPAAFDLGEHLRVVLLSTPEGDDKAAKYPTLFQKADAVLLTKMDLAEVLEFNKQRVYDDLAQINSKVPVFELSAKSGAGMEDWLGWLKAQRAKYVAG